MICKRGTHRLSWGRPSFFVVCQAAQQPVFSRVPGCAAAGSWSSDVQWYDSALGIQLSALGLHRLEAARHQLAGGRASHKCESSICLVATVGPYGGCHPFESSNQDWRRWREVLPVFDRRRSADRAWSICMAPSVFPIPVATLLPWPYICTNEFLELPANSRHRKETRLRCSDGC